MASTGAAFFVSLVIASCVLSGVSATLEDGRPRPKNFPDPPTETYDNTPQLTDSSGLPVNCIWYGFANENFDVATTSSCLLVVRKALLNATVNPPSSMKPYMYYTLKRLIDPATSQAYCYQGCFNLGASVAPSPGVASAPAPLAAAPPPLTFGVPPSNTFSPAPSVFPGAPPPMDTSPLGAAVPPASIIAPPGSSPAPSVGVPSSGPVSSPPAPPTSPVVLPNAGAYLQPAALFSFLVAVVALFFNLAA